jgi:hypothetical protein
VPVTSTFATGWVGSTSTTSACASGEASVASTASAEPVIAVAIELGAAACLRLRI